MIEMVAKICLLVTAGSLVAAVYRILRGPSIADRIAASDLLTTCVMAVIVTAGILAESRVYMDVVMAIAVLGFFGSVAFSRYLLRGRAID